MSEKKAYTPAEFAALFSREKTWTYRLLYAGKIKGIKDYGHLMIPASEADRIAREAEKNKKPEQEPTPSAATEPPKGSAAWANWVEKRKAKATKTKGMGHGAKRKKVGQN